MKSAKVLLSIASILFFSHAAYAQKTEITIAFSEQFFDALLDAVFQHSAPPEFSLAGGAAHGMGDQAPVASAFRSGFSEDTSGKSSAAEACNESITLLRENGNVKTAVRFRDGKIVAPLAFKGNYNPPLIGCVPFAGLAETVIELEFDREAQRLIARAKVRDVSLNGTGGLGGSVIARLVQGSIDKKINPIEIVRTDKVSFVVPMQNSTSVRMKAIGFSHYVLDGQLNIRVAYEFTK